MLDSSTLLDAPLLGGDGSESSPVLYCLWPALRLLAQPCSTVLIARLALSNVETQPWFLWQ